MRVVIKLDKLLNDRNMSQHELSRLTGIRQPSINEMCRNQTRRIPADNLAKICEVLNCEISDLLELVKENPDC
ncbi:putative transcriptional regulator [Bacillus sp. OV166]|uniref:helix-turn-helix domain-containing protein n=1 Tax=Bacillus sp. OV166 TaxID=1882763 RepID=UPI000A2AA68D|nr:helix-turn-helix transcriptional regulator [Bacillus sp. OV166]SMQ75997.1 putative transcriptional regulator [Bacillus sp. OV166]